MITSTILATLMEPVTPGQSPIPVVIIQQEEHGMTTGEWWVTVSAFVLAGTTLATVVHVDVVLHHVLNLIKALSPSTRRTLPGRVRSRSTDNAEPEPINKIIKPRV